MNPVPIVYVSIFLLYFIIQIACLDTYLSQLFSMWEMFAHTLCWHHDNRKQLASACERWLQYSVLTYKKSADLSYQISSFALQNIFCL